VSKSGFVEPGGTQVQVGSGTGALADAYDADKLIAAFYDAAAAMDEKGISTDGRVGVLNPRQYYSLIQKVGENGLVNRDEQGASLQSGQGVVSIAGIKIYKSMNIPFFNKYGVDYGNLGTGDTDPGNRGSFIGVDMERATKAETGGNHYEREAAGCVEAIAPQVQVTSGDVSVIYQGDVILGRLAMGADFLNPAAAVELHATSTAPSAFGTSYPANDA